MFELTVEGQFSAAHWIRGHSGRCAQVHGHNYRVVVVAAAEGLGQHDMVMDFGELREVCRQALDPLDHTMLNDLPPFAGVNPTAEVLARHIYRAVADHLSRLRPAGARLVSVTVHESDRSSATYRE